MLERAAATAAAEGVANATFEQGDAQVHPFGPGTLDVAISRYGVMFFNDPVVAFTNIRVALRSDGRLAFLCWQDLTSNEWLMTTAGVALQHVPMPDLGAPGAPGPFAFADPERVQAILEQAGFNDIRVDPVEAPMRLGDNAEDAVVFLRGTGVGRALLEKRGRRVHRTSIGGGHRCPAATREAGGRVSEGRGLARVRSPRPGLSRTALRTAREGRAHQRVRGKEEDTMGFIQIIEYKTSRIDELNAMLDAWLERTKGKRLATRGTQTRDRDAENTYVQIVEFPSYEDAMANSKMPETGEFAAKLAALCDGPPSFRNLDVIREEQM
jgi:hypothetical protein